MRIIIHLEGGLVQSCFQDGGGQCAGATVVDFDTDGADEDEIVRFKDKDGVIKTAYMHSEELFKLPGDCDIVKALAVYNKEVIAPDPKEGMLFRGHS